MDILIIYESMTSNTKQIAEAIKDVLKSDHKVKCFNVADILEDELEVNADLYFLGSWTNKGSCGNLMAEFAKTLKNQNLALFQTAGFGGSKDYYANLEKRFASNIDDSNNIIDSFYCQGKMQDRFKDHYVKMLKLHPDDKDLKVSIDNFDHAKIHPNRKDLINAKEFALNVIKKITK